MTLRHIGVELNAQTDNTHSCAETPSADTKNVFHTTLGCSHVLPARQSEWK